MYIYLSRHRYLTFQKLIYARVIETLKMLDLWTEGWSIWAVNQFYTLLSMILGVVLGEFFLRISLGLESLWKTILEPRKSKMKVIRKNLWLCMADKNGQIWKVANVLIKY